MKVINKDLLKKYSFHVLVIMLLAVIFIGQFWLTMNNCFNASDLGIYGQALIQMVSNNDFNPWLTVRGLYLFQDHFNPILIFFSFVLHFFPKTIFSILTIDFLFFIGFIFLLIKECRKNKLSKMKLIIVISSIVFGRGVLNALTFPIHPIAWCPIPLLLMFQGHYYKKDFHLIAGHLLLNGLREEFCFASISYAVIGLLMRRQLIANTINLCIGLAFLFFNFYLRAKVFDGVYSYGSIFFSSLFDNPKDFMIGVFQSFNYKQWKMFVPFLMLFSMNYKSLMKKRIELIPIVGFFAPIFAIRFLTDKFLFHYSIPLFILFTLTYLFYAEDKIKYVKGRKMRLGNMMIILLFFFTSTSVYQRYILSFFSSSYDKCKFDKESRDNNYYIVDHLEDHPASNIYATGGIVPVILRPNMNIYPAGGYGKRQKVYHYLILERNNYGDLWPLQKQDIESLISHCRVFAKSILIDSNKIFFAKGVFPRSCIKSAGVDLGVLRGVTKR